MTRTIAEAIAVVDTAVKKNKVMTVGVQSMADPTWRAPTSTSPPGNIGHVLQGQTSYYRNSIGGQWRYYPLTKRHDARRPSTVVNLCPSHMSQSIVFGFMSLVSG